LPILIDKPKKKFKSSVPPNAPAAQELVNSYISGEDARLVVEKEKLAIRKEEMELRREEFALKKEELLLNRQKSAAIILAADKVAILATEMTTYYKNMNEKFGIA
jgi:hypothetical protein